MRDVPVDAAPDERTGGVQNLYWKSLVRLGKPAVCSGEPQSGGCHARVRLPSRDHS